MPSGVLRLRSFPGAHQALPAVNLARGAFWIAVYLALVLAPLFAMLVGPTPSGRGFWWELSIALGFAATSMLGIQFALTARFRRATAP